MLRIVNTFSSFDRLAIKQLRFNAGRLCFSKQRQRPQSRGHNFSLRLLGVVIGTITIPVIAYDGVRYEFTYCGATFRFLRSLKTSCCIAWDYMLLERHEADKDYEKQLKFVHQKSAYRLLDTCLRNGGLYIKVGQGFAAINHILPREYVDTLLLLQNECLPTSRKDVQKVFREDFDGRLPEEVFAEFDYKPKAAASLAQVFKAKLHNGQTVAVKVQYSDLQKRFSSDLGTIIFLQDIIEFFFKNYNFGWILHDVRKNLEQELNFINEGANAERCAHDMAKFKYVHVPEVQWDYTKLRVLTMEWIDGFKVSDIDEVKHSQLDLKDIDVKLFKVFAEQIFNTGFVHADPHSANVFVRKNPKTAEAELVLLDHGLYEELPQEVRLPLCEFWEATVLRDEENMEKAARSIGIRDYMKFAEVLFQQPIVIHAGRIRTKLTQSDIEYMQDIAKKNFDVIMQTLQEMPRNMLFVVRNLNTIRAISRQHGDVVNRPAVMARHAQRCLFLLHHNSLMGSIRWLYHRVFLEYYLWRSNLKVTCLNLYFNLLYRLGRAPEAAKTILSDITSHDLS